MNSRNSKRIDISHHRYLSRMLTVFLGIAAALIVCNILLGAEAMAWAVAVRQWSMSGGDLVAWPLLALYYSILYGPVVLIPVLPLIVYSEWKRITDARVYCAMAAGIMILGYTALLLDDPKVMHWNGRLWIGLARRLVPDVLIAMIGGLVYWRIAGRTAGAWRTLTVPPSAGS